MKPKSNLSMLVLASFLGLSPILNGCATIELNPTQKRMRAEYIDQTIKRFGIRDRTDASMDNLREEIWEDLENLTDEEFERYTSVRERAHKLSGINNPQRYSTDLLEESNRNLTDANYKADKPLALFFVAQNDDVIYELTKIGINVRPLDVQTKDINQFTDSYKVMVFGFSNAHQISRHLRKVAELYDGKNTVAGMVIGGHGSTTDIDSGYRYTLHNLSSYNASRIFEEFVDMFDEDATIVMSACNNGTGREEILNLANAVAGVFPKRTVHSCDGTLVNIRWNLGEDGKVNPDSLKLSKLGPTGWPFVDCTYRARFESKEDFDAKSSQLVRNQYQNIFGMEIEEVLELARVPEEKRQKYFEGHAGIELQTRIAKPNKRRKALRLKGDRLREALEKRKVWFQTVGYRISITEQDFIDEVSDHYMSFYGMSVKEALDYAGVEEGDRRSYIFGEQFLALDGTARDGKGRHYKGDKLREAIKTGQLRFLR
jgi:hypothetical protein